MTRSLKTFLHILIVFKLFGLIHFDVDSGVLPLLALNILLGIYFAIFVLLLLWMHSLDGLYAFSNNFQEYVNFEMLRLIERSGFLCNQLTTWLAIIKSVVNYKQQLEILKNTDVMDDHIEKHFMLKSPSNKLQIICKVYTIFVSYLLLFGFPLFFLTTPALPWEIPYFLDYIWSPMVLQAGIAKYVFYVNILRCRTQTLREILRDLVEYPAQRRSVMINKILTVKKIYSLIYDNTRLINSTLGLPIMFLFGVVLVVIIKNIYLLFLEFLSTEVDVGNTISNYLT